MNIGCLYTLYGRRAGVELYFEKIAAGLLAKYPDLIFTVFCNREAGHALPEGLDRMRKQILPNLENPFSKALWLEYQATGPISLAGVEVMWIPSGTNHFPGRWTPPSVVTIHDLAEYRVRGRYGWLRMLYRKRLCLPRSIRRAAVITTVSETTARDVQAEFKPGRAPVVIYSGPSPRPVTLNVEQPEEVIRRETSQHFSRILLFAGRTDYQGKGLDVLLRAYRQLGLERPDAPPLVLVGPPGEGHNRVLRDIADLGLSSRVKWLGRVSDLCLDALYRISELVVLPSRYEGFGFPVLEGMWHGVPVVCSRAGALPEIAGSAACLVEPGQAGALLQALSSVLADPSVRARLISAGRARVQEFDWDRTFTGMRAVFDQAAGMAGALHSPPA